MQSFPQGLMSHKTAPVDEQGGGNTKNIDGPDVGEEGDRDDIGIKGWMDYSSHWVHFEEDSMHNEHNQSQSDPDTQPPTINDLAATQSIFTLPRQVQGSLDGPTSSDIHDTMSPPKANGAVDGLKNEVARLQAAVTCLETMFCKRSTRMEK